MNCCRLTTHLVNGPQRFSKVITCVGRYRTINQSLVYNPASVRSYYNGCRLVESFRSRLRKAVQRHASAVLCACSHQAQCVVGHRVWRGQQAGTLYLKLWGGVALTGLVSSLVSRIFVRAVTFMCHSIKSKGSRLLLSCSGAFMFDWKKNRIPDEDLTKYFDDIEAALCLKRRTFDIGHPSIVTTLCTCDGGRANHSQFERESDPWSSFLMLQHLLVWKREVPNHRGDGLYEYKVYGKYSDVSALDFLAVNINHMYRKMWDNGAVVLEVLESEPETKSDIIYWEVAWPRMMNNRDYVYQRRYTIDERKNVIVIVNQNAAHPQIPPLLGKERISEYWSIIVIKPLNEFNKPGIEFTMTYFDNPGANVPASITAWASATAFPDFHRRLHVAAKAYQSKRKEIDAFTKSEHEAGVTVKAKKPKMSGSAESHSADEPGLYIDEETKRFIKECEMEEEERKKEEEKGEIFSSTSKKRQVRTRSGCVIRKRSDAMYQRLATTVV